MPEAAPAPHRIVVIATRQIGDVLLTTPLIRDAKRLWPAAEVDVLGFAGTLGMLAGNPDIHRLIEAPSSRRGHRLEFLRFMSRLWRRYDLAFITQHSDRAHLYGFIAARKRVGVVSAQASHSWWKRRLLAHAVTIAGDQGSVHAAAEKLALLDAFRAASSDAPAAAVVATGRAPLPPDLEVTLVPGFVVVQVPSMWRYKQWPVEHFRALVDSLVHEGRQVVLTGSGAAGDRDKVAAVATVAAPPLVIDVAGRLDFAQLSELLARAALYVGPDTSVTHLAAAAGTPVVALFGPTNPLRWGPIDPRGATLGGWDRRSVGAARRGHIVIMQGPGACVPCGRAGCDDHRDSVSRCLEAITPREVMAEVHRSLAAHEVVAA